MWIEPRHKPYIVGEIGFLVERRRGDEKTIELLTEPAGNGFVLPATRTVGMGCVEATNAEGHAFVRRLSGEELAEALEEFGAADLELSAS